MIVSILDKVHNENSHSEIKTWKNVQSIKRKLRNANEMLSPGAPSITDNEKNFELN